jgi:hypothetical protein
VDEQGRKASGAVSIDSSDDSLIDQINQSINQADQSTSPRPRRETKINLRASTMGSANALMKTVAGKTESLAWIYRDEPKSKRRRESGTSGESEPKRARGAKHVLATPSA